jgi:cytochrome b561
MKKAKKIKSILLYFILLVVILLGIAFVTTMLLKWYYKF